MSNSKLTKHDAAIFADEYQSIIDAPAQDFSKIGVDLSQTKPFEKVTAKFENPVTKSADPTRDAFHNLMAKINLAEAQSQLTGEALERFKRVSRKAINPNHYVSPAQKKAQKKPRFAVLDKTFGARKRVIFVEGKDGEAKPITIKNAKKQGLI